MKNPFWLRIGNIWLLPFLRIQFFFKQSAFSLLGNSFESEKDYLWKKNSTLARTLGFEPGLKLVLGTGSKKVQGFKPVFGSGLKLITTRTHTSLKPVFALKFHLKNISFIWEKRRLWQPTFFISKLSMSFFWGKRGLWQPIFRHGYIAHKGFIWGSIT